MNDLNLSFLNNINDEDKILLNQISDWIYLAENKYITKFSFFLNEKQVMLCEKVLKSLKFKNYKFYGGCDEAERKVLCIYSQYDEINNDDFPIEPLTFKYRPHDKLSHRDFLGVLMSLNVARNTVGDIKISNGCAVVFLYNTVSQLALESISKIGRVGVTVSEGASVVVPNIKSFQEITGSVASLRIDCIIALALRVSREKARTIILSRGIDVNYLTVNKPDFLLREKDKFSVKGYGKFLFDSVNGISQKNRFHITLKKYI